MLELPLLASARAVLFVVLSGFLIICSWRPLHNSHSHGFYRFFAFEGILLLLLLNLPYWFHQMYSPLQLLSWVLLFLSIGFVVQGLWLLKKKGGYEPRQDPENFAFENTKNLVTEGIYKYIRHPMYSSLLLLAWGICFKQVTLYTVGLAIIVTVFLVITAKTEERENIVFFGQEYRDYISRSKMFFHCLF